jgi:hypothetical protein
MATHNGNVRGQAETLIISGVVLAGFEGLGLCCSDSAGGCSGWILVMVHWLAYCCYIAGPFGVWHEMSHAKSIFEKLKRIWSWYFLGCAIAAVFAFFIWRPEPRPNLHLVLYADVESSLEQNLDFTNKNLVVKLDRESFKIPPNLPFLVVDVSRYDPQFTLYFGIRNPAPRFSPPVFNIEKPEIQVWVVNPDPGETVKWNTDAKWKEVTALGALTNGAPTNFPGRVFLYQFPDPLAAGTGNDAPGITFNMQEKPGKLTVAVMTVGEGVIPTVYCFDLLAVPSDEAVTKIRFDTNSTIWWNWKYRPVAYRPIDTPLLISPSRVQLSDGKNTFGKEVVVSNPSSSNLYAITLGVEIESNAVPISSPLIELSQPTKRDAADGGELHIMFEASMDFIGYTQSRLFVIPTLEANGQRSFWIRGTILTNSFADISIWQSMNSFPDVKYTTNGLWMWPVFSTNSAWWIHSGGQPMDLAVGVMAWRGNATNGFTNDSQIIPSRP